MHYFFGDFMEKAETKQTVLLENRKKITVDNVINVAHFNDDYLEITSSSGDMGIEGENLKIEALSQDNGKITVTGDITGFFYKRGGKDKKGLFSSIFK